MNSRITVECRQFSANIFNNKKCSQCFHQRDDHSALALESNRKARKVSKCGYLFVAPDWDFTNPLYRTKRWQRRWFVLYDDGQLTYAVDDHPETIPQAIIDMSSVIEVAPAEDITGHQYSIGLTVADRVTFIKGTCFEEAKWWLDVLSIHVSLKVRNKKTKIVYLTNSKSALSFDEQTSQSPPTREKAFLSKGNYKDPYFVDSIDTIDSVRSPKNIEPKAWFNEEPTRDEEPSFKKSSSYRPGSLQILSSVSHPVGKPSLKNNHFDSATCSMYGRISSSTSSPQLVSPASSIRQSCQTQLPKSATERGDPDGDCGLPNEFTTSYVSRAEQRSSEQEIVSNDEILSIRKGWLFKQGKNAKEWSRYWFSQKGAALFYYRDPVAEERGVLDGVLDVNNITTITEVNVSKGFGFQLLTWDERRFILAASSVRARSSWMNIIKCAAGLIKLKSSYDLNSNLNTPEKSSQPQDHPKFKTTQYDKNFQFSFSSDEEYRTASEGGKRDSVDLGSPLSPSPPILKSHERLKTEEKLRRISRGKLKRHDTIDSITSDDLPPTVSEESELQLKLAEAEKEIKVLQKEIQDRDKELSDLLVALKKTELELTSRVKDAENEKDRLTAQLEESTQTAQQVIENLKAELEQSRECNKDLEEQLAKGIVENETLYKQIQIVSPAASFCDLSRNKIKRMDSFSDLANLSDLDPYCVDKESLVEEYTELKSRFEKAINELKIMKRELRDAHNMYDLLELQFNTFKMRLEQQKVDEQDQAKMMAARIQDLTSKYSASEKNIRNLKQKLLRTEKRRTLSLKGKEVMSLQKDLEEKVNDLQTKIDMIAPLPATISSKNSPSESTKKRIRRKSLDSASTASSPIQLIVRLNNLEKQLESRTGLVLEDAKEDNTLTRIKYLEAIISSSQDIIRCNIKYLQSLKSQLRVSADTREMLRHVEKSLNDSLKILKSDSDNEIRNIKLKNFEQIRSILSKLDNQIRAKLADLLVQRKLLKESNKLTQEKDLELLAERIAFESVSFGRLRNAVNFGEEEAKAPQTEIEETKQSILILKNRLCGKQSHEIMQNSTDVLVNVLSRRLIFTASKLKNQAKQSQITLNSETLADLLVQQRDLSDLVKQYKSVVLERLVCLLIFETSDAPNTEVVENAIHEIRKVSSECIQVGLIHNEMFDLMCRNAQRLQHGNNCDSGYMMDLREHLTFENVADKAQELLNYEIKACGLELRQLFLKSMESFSEEKLRVQVDLDKKDLATNLRELAEVLAQKTLIDARIAVFSGSKTISGVVPYKPTVNNVVQIQKYEELFCNLCQDLEIARPEDILAEADFNLMYRYFTTEFFINNLELKNVCSALNKLEKTIHLLRNLIGAESDTPIESLYEADSIDDVVNKCLELESTVNSVLVSVKNLKDASEEFNQMEGSYNALVLEHGSNMNEIKKRHLETVEILTEQVGSCKRTIEAFASDKNDIIQKLEGEKQVFIQQEKELKQVVERAKINQILSIDKELENLELLQKLENAHSELAEYKQKYEDIQEKFNIQCQETFAIQSERNEAFLKFKKEQDRCKKIEMHLENLQEEFDDEVKRLQEFSREQLPDKLCPIVDNDSLRKRYQAEIEQLRSLCEKGLAAMEASHKKIIQEMQEKHREEVQQLLAEKDQALAEETQATLAALDAMRKAHQVEVQREIARFKQEFLRQTQRVSNAGCSVKEKEQLSEVRNEILSLSEKYTTKCVEAAALEEKLKIVSQMLKETQHRVEEFERTYDSQEKESLSKKLHHLHPTKASKCPEISMKLLAQDELNYSMFSNITAKKQGTNEERSERAVEYTLPLPSDGKDVERIQRGFELDI